MRVSEVGIDRAGVEPGEDLAVLHDIAGVNPHPGQAQTVGVGTDTVSCQATTWPVAGTCRDGGHLRRDHADGRTGVAVAPSASPPLTTMTSNAMATTPMTAKRPRCDRASRRRHASGSDSATHIDAPRRTQDAWAGG